MEFLFDPTLWVGLLTLVVLELVLGIDNLVFIAILAKKLPAKQQDRALYTGLGMAIFLRLALLSVMSWLVGLTAPLFTLWGHSFSLRDLILCAGGLFLLFKATSELHERLEARPHEESAAGSATSFWLVIVQILILDAVFSLDSIITAVGMVDNLGVMMAAVVIAIGVMMLASRPLTAFVNAHPTVVVLCLSFLLMIGLSLVADGFGFHIPKGYLYAAIGFSVMIEFFNQLAARNLRKHTEKLPFRARTLSAIVNLMGRPGEKVDTAAKGTAADGKPDMFAEEERHMVEGVLSLAERTVKTIMTPRCDVVWIDLEHPVSEIAALIKREPHSCYPVCEGSLDNVIGILKAKDLAGDTLNPAAIADIARRRRALVVPETVSVIGLMRNFQEGNHHIILVADEFGIIQGLVTTHDLLEAIAGDFPDENEGRFIEPIAGGWSAEGAADLFLVEQTTQVSGLRPENDSCATLAGLLLEKFGRIPTAGESITFSGLRFDVVKATRSRIERVRISRADAH